MHSKIIELSETPLKEDERVDESQFYDGFCGWIADYVDDVDDDIRSIVISDWKECFNMVYGDFVTIEEDYIVFKKGFKDAYANNILECTKDIIKKADIEAVKNGSFYYTVKELLGDPFGIYIYESGLGLTTENVYLVRYLEEDTPYYFGGVVDYHY